MYRQGSEKEKEESLQLIFILNVNIGQGYRGQKNPLYYRDINRNTIIKFIQFYLCSTNDNSCFKVLDGLR